MGIGFLLYLIAGYNRKKIISEPSENVISPGVKTTVTIGKYLFNMEDQILKLDGIETVLTAKEAKILGIFAHAPNEVIDRKRLQKEIWEDEGVIVGRSLDMFISRLRKKLENDPDVKLVNIHGRGYKLEVNNG
jgi:DNA-binding response OmpR family regulator